MNIKNCRICGQIYQYDGFALCPKCRRELEKDFKIVKEYIYQNPGANISEVHEVTEVELEKIIEFLKEGRLEIAKGGNLILECERCGKSITTGRFCNECTSQLQKELGGATAVAEVKKKEKSKNDAKFRYINRDYDRR